MLITTEGIVLKQRKIANNRRMITIFTKSHGKISAGTSINEKSKGKNALALRPFSYAEYEIFNNRESYNINSTQLKKSYYSIGEDLDRFLVASQFIDYLDKILEEEQPRPKLFEMTLEFFESITKSSGNYDTLFFAFLVKTLRVQGVMPELRTCVNCGKSLNDFGYEIEGGKKGYLFSVTSGGVICEDCARREKESSSSLIFKPSFDIIDMLHYFINNPISRFEKVRIKSEIIQETKKILGTYTEHYLGIDSMNINADWR